MTMRNKSIIVGVTAAIIGSASAQSCLSTTNGLTFREEQLTSNYTEVREYIMCPNTVYNIGTLDINNNLMAGGQDYIQARPNLHLKCGADGKRANNCVISGGDVQVEATEFFGERLPVTNVRFEGFVFALSNRYNVWATKPGNITFVDCEFRQNTRALTPVYLDHYNSTHPMEQLRVTFEGCSFTNNRYFGEGASPAVVVGNGNQNTLHFDRCIFSGNDFVFNNTQFEKSSALVETSGPITMLRSCFENNQVGVSSVVAYGTTVTSSLNYGMNTNGQKCQFISSFESSLQYRFFSPNCINFDVTSTCLALTTGVPSSSPTLVPTGEASDPPTMIPTISPSDFPSTVPSTRPTVSDSGIPSSAPSNTVSPTASLPPTINLPSGSPSFSPSTSPTTSPSEVPSASPSKVPITSPVASSQPTPIPTDGGNSSGGNPTGGDTSAPVAGPGPFNPGQSATSSATARSIVFSVLCLLLGIVL